VVSSGQRTLYLLRHGQSEANSADSFSGWLDVPLSARGRREAARAGRLLAGQVPLPDVVHTSVLARAVDTAALALGELGLPSAPVRHSWRLNERHYGALQGRPRAEVRRAVGDEAYRRLRRSYEAVPPPLPLDDPGHPRRDPRYADVPDDELPAGESLADVRARVQRYWEEAIVPALGAGRVPLVVAHGNALRALCMLLDDLSPEQVRTLHVPTGVPLRYDLGTDLRPLVPGGRYLDPDAAAAGIAEVAAQGSGPILTGPAQP
jgi:2,3-bisphosphoglycerate-dependent phosphoglycerate mutase